MKRDPRLEEHSFFEGNIVGKIFPPTYELLPGTCEIFELELAYGEMTSLKPKELLKRSGFFSHVSKKPTMHFQLCLATPIDEIRSGKTVWVKSFFEANRFSTGYATHSLFPYRGKFHPQLVKGILNVTRTREGDLILDPMGGSGTTSVEANLMNMNSISIDISPLCTLMARVKTEALDLDMPEYEELIEIDTLFSTIKDELEETSRFDDIEGFYDNIKILGDKKVDRVLLLAYLDTVGYARRRKTGSVAELFLGVLRRYVATIRAFSQNREELGISIGNSKILTSDSRRLKLPDKSVDAIITSPPYSFAIDYAENDKPQLEMLGIDVSVLKNNMIGLVGASKEERIKNYFKDMDNAISEMSRVLKDNRYCVIIVGSNSIQTGGVRHEEEFKKSADRYGLVLARDLEKSISGIQNSMKDEHVLFFQKD